MIDSLIDSARFAIVILSLLGAFFGFLWLLNLVAAGRPEKNYTDDQLRKWERDD